MSLPKYVIRINGRYLRGYDETRSMGKTGHMGWQPVAMDMPAIVLIDNIEEARIIEGSIELRSQIHRITDRVRYADLVLNRLEVVKVGETP